MTSNSYAVPLDVKTWRDITIRHALIGLLGPELTDNEAVKYAALATEKEAREARKRKALESQCSNALLKRKSQIFCGTFVCWTIFAIYMIGWHAFGCVLLTIFGMNRTQRCLPPRLDIRASVVVLTSLCPAYAMVDTAREGYNFLWKNYSDLVVLTMLVLASAVIACKFYM